MANGSKCNLFSREGSFLISTIVIFVNIALHDYPAILLSTILYKFTFLSDRLKIEGANVINMDIPATNGVIQVNHENMWGWWLINWSTGRWWFPCRPTMFFLCRLWKVSSSSLALSPSREKQFDILISFVRRSQSIWHSAFCCRSRLTLHDHQTVKNAFMSILFVLYKALLKFILLLWFDIWYSEIYGTRYLQQKKRPHICEWDLPETRGTLCRAKRLPKVKMENRRQAFDQSLDG